MITTYAITPKGRRVSVCQCSPSLWWNGFCVGKFATPHDQTTGAVHPSLKAALAIADAQIDELEGDGLCIDRYPDGDLPTIP